MDTCTGCKLIKCVPKSKEHYEKLHFDEQTKSWWCYNCCGYAEVSYCETGGKPAIKIITDDVVKK